MPRMSFHHLHIFIVYHVWHGQEAHVHHSPWRIYKCTWSLQVHLLSWTCEPWYNRHGWPDVKNNNPCLWHAHKAHENTFCYGCDMHTKLMSTLFAMDICDMHTKPMHTSFTMGCAHEACEYTIYHICACEHVIQHGLHAHEYIIYQGSHVNMKLMSTPLPWMKYAHEATSTCYKHSAWHFGSKPHVHKELAPTGGSCLFNQEKTIITCIYSSSDTIL